MIITPDIASDIDAAHDLISRDASPNAMSAAASLLEESARRIREATDAERQRIAEAKFPLQSIEAETGPVS